jgi:ATP-binding cassette subfamily B protein
MYFTSTALGFAVAVVVMLWIDTRLTILALLPLPAVTLAARYFGKAIHDRFERIQAQLSELSAVAQEALSGVRVVRAYRQEQAELSRFREANDEYVRRNQGLIRLQAAFYPGLTFCFGLSGLAVLWFGGKDVMAGQLTLGEFVAFGRYLVLLSWPLVAFGWVINMGQRGVASWERMLEVLDATPEPAPDQASAPEARAAAGRIEARHLTFSYPNTTHTALDDVSFVVEPGQTLAIVGPTGSGKSTLVNLLPRWRQPPAGTLFIDGVDICDMALPALRAAIGMVPQEPFLFSDTVGGNVMFGAGTGWSAAELPPAREASRLAGVSDDIEGFQNGYDTMVGERGITLSGGQKQRVALARALVIDPKILVLDDSLSAVDTATEEQILHHLRDVRKHRTAVVVAHRVSTVRDADLILVIADGRVVERGTHDMLVALNGAYAEMHRRQRLEEELASV